MGKKTLLHQSFFPMNPTPESSRSVSENLSEGRFIMHHWGEKRAIQGQIVIQAVLCKYTELQPVKTRPCQRALGSQKKMYPVKRVQKVCLCACAHRCMNTGTMLLLLALKKSSLDCFRNTYVHCDGQQPYDFQVFLLASTSLVVWFVVVVLNSFCNPMTRYID